jgi:hypothetical protein
MVLFFKTSSNIKVLSKFNICTRMVSILTKILNVCNVRYISDSCYVIVYEYIKMQFSSLGTVVDVYCLMMAL